MLLARIDWWYCVFWLIRFQCICAFCLQRLTTNTGAFVHTYIIHTTNNNLWTVKQAREREEEKKGSNCIPQIQQFVGHTILFYLFTCDRVIFTCCIYWIQNWQFRYASMRERLVRLETFSNIFRSRHFHFTAYFFLMVHSDWQHTVITQRSSCLKMK